MVAGRVERIPAVRGWVSPSAHGDGRKGERAQFGATSAAVVVRCGYQRAMTRHARQNRPPRVRGQRTRKHRAEVSEQGCAGSPRRTGLHQAAHDARRRLWRGRCRGSACPRRYQRSRAAGAATRRRRCRIRESETARQCRRCGTHPGYRRGIPSPSTCTRARDEESDRADARSETVVGDPQAGGEEGCWWPTGYC
jgi:hypothetical protein